MRHLHRDLDRLKRQILAMGGMVESEADKAISALLERRADLAEEVMANDDAQIDEMELEIEEECLKILALHQPVAGDLRFIIIVLKVNNDLERVGDLAVNIAERAAFLACHPPLAVPTDFRDMAERVRRMLRDTLDALVGQDTSLARRVLTDDESVDRIHRRMYTDLQELMKSDPERIERAISFLTASRCLERMADLATNVAEDVVFLVEGVVIRHVDNTPEE